MMIVGIGVNLMGLRDESDQTLARVRLAVEFVDDELQGILLLLPSPAELDEFGDQGFLIDVMMRSPSRPRHRIVGPVGPFVDLGNHPVIPEVPRFDLPGRAIAANASSMPCRRSARTKRAGAGPRHPPGNRRACRRGPGRHRHRDRRRGTRPGV